MRTALCSMKSKHFFYILIVFAGVHDTLVGILKAGNGEAVELQDLPVLQGPGDGCDTAAEIAVRGCPGGNVF